MSELVRYRVIKKCFVNDGICDPALMPSPYVMAKPGLAGAALVLAPVGDLDPREPSKSGQGSESGKAPAVNNQDSQRIAELEKQVAARDAVIASAEDAVADLQDRLDATRVAHASELAARDTQIADLTAPKAQKAK